MNQPNNVDITSASVTFYIVYGRNINSTKHFKFEIIKKRRKSLGIIKVLEIEDLGKSIMTKYILIINDSFIVSMVGA